MEEGVAEAFLGTKRDRRWLQSRMRDWFASQARELPWRGTRDLYRIWISEIMLQQTQVASVIGYFERFLAAFPTLDRLAAADEQEVLRLWEGLGYYSRARRLHAAAKTIVERHVGRFPETFDEVVALPGIGRYTAGAILSIGRDIKLPILEANTVRLLSRLIALREPTTSAEGKRRLWQTAEDLLPDADVGLFNQSLMELGALVCTPRKPDCLLCPLMQRCPTRRFGLQEEIPVAEPKMKYEEVSEAAFAIRRKDGRILMRKRRAKERWAGLWDFPRLPMAEPTNDASSLSEPLKLMTGQDVVDFDLLGRIKHGVTRFRITLHVFFTLARTAKAFPHDEELQWMTLDEIIALGLHTSSRKMAKMLITDAALRDVNSRR